MSSTFIRTTVCAVALLFTILSSVSFAQDTNTTKALHALFDREWRYELQENPTRASQLGDRRWNDRWPDRSLAAIQRRHEHNVQVLKELSQIDRSKLSTADQLNYDLFKKDYETDIEEHQYRWYLVPLNQRGGIQTQNELADSLRFATVKDYEDWIARLNSFPAYMDQTMALMREGSKARMVLPKVIMQRVPGQIEKQLVTKPEDSPFYKPFKRYPANISSADQQRLSRAAVAAISANIIPSYQRFNKFFVGEYLPSTFDEVGAWQMPQGEAMYAFLTRKFTTTNTTPREVHERGLSEVKRIRAAMHDVMNKVGFKGTLPEFFNFLRTDKQFYYEKPEDLLAAYEAMSKRIDPHLVKVFKTLPRMPYGVEVIPAGSQVVGKVISVTRASRKSKAGTLGVHFVSLRLPTGIARAMNGGLTNTSEEMNADSEGSVEADSATKRNVVFIGGGAATGALIGAIAGGGKGAGIGAGVGAGLGVAGALFSKGHEVEVKSGAEFGVILNQSLSLPKANVR